MRSLFGIEIPAAAQYVIAFVVIFILLALFALILRRVTGGRLTLPGQDRGRTRQPRLGVVDIYDLDRQRQLVLVRRDNTEHLVMIGGPNDVVVESNIIRSMARSGLPFSSDAERGSLSNDTENALTPSSLVPTLPTVSPGSGVREMPPLQAEDLLRPSLSTSSVRNEQRTQDMRSSETASSVGSSATLTSSPPAFLQENSRPVASPAQPGASSSSVERFSSSRGAESSPSQPAPHKPLQMMPLPTNEYVPSGEKLATSTASIPGSLPPPLASALQTSAPASSPSRSQTGEKPQNPSKDASPSTPVASSDRPASPLSPSQTAMSPISLSREPALEDMARQLEQILKVPEATRRQNASQPQNTPSASPQQGSSPKPSVEKLSNETGMQRSRSPGMVQPLPSVQQPSGASTGQKIMSRTPAKTSPETPVATTQKATHPSRPQKEDNLTSPGAPARQTEANPVPRSPESSVSPSDMPESASHKTASQSPAPVNPSQGSSENDDPFSIEAIEQQFALLLGRNPPQGQA